MRTSCYLSLISIYLPFLLWHLLAWTRQNLSQEPCLWFSCPFPIKFNFVELCKTNDDFTPTLTQNDERPWKIFCRKINSYVLWTLSKIQNSVVPWWFSMNYFSGAKLVFSIIYDVFDNATVSTKHSPLITSISCLSFVANHLNFS